MSIEINVVNPQGTKKQHSKPLKKTSYQSIDYASLRNLTQPNTGIILLPGLGTKGLKILAKNQAKQPALIEQPQLLSTAKEYLKSIYEEPVVSEAELSNNLGLSSFLNSREVTPNNPLLSSHSKRKNAPSQKNKLNSLATELFDIQSNPDAQETRASKIRKAEFRLNDCILGQNDVVYTYVFGKQRNVNPKLITMWKDCLTHQEKSEIYLPVGDQKVEIPFSHARVYPLNQIQKQFKEIFGTGKNRALTAGEEAIVIESIRRYLTLSSKEPLKIGRKDYDIIEDILKDCKLSQLQNFPLCMKQVETHFRLMATKWKYSGELNYKDRIMQSALVMGKNNFLDLTKDNILTKYLLSNSNIEEI